MVMLRTLFANAKKAFETLDPEDPLIRTLFEESKLKPFEWPAQTKERGDAL